MITSTVRRTVHERALVSPGDHVLVACSGGPDSTTLLHVLHRLRSELGITLCVASIDHGLRPESAFEVEQVGAFASTLGLPFYPVRVDLAAEGVSIQARARELRYEALHEVARSHDAVRIAVGHTQDDQAETVLARMLRGAGLRGLGGIEARRSDGVIRPLLDCSRADVRTYALEHELSVQAAYVAKSELKRRGAWPVRAPATSLTLVPVSLSRPAVAIATARKMALPLFMVSIHS